MIRKDDADNKKSSECENELQTMARFARCQAQEAHIRAQYALELADRAVTEAEAVREIALSMTHTATAVARMSLEHMERIQQTEGTECRSFRNGDISRSASRICQQKPVASATLTPTSQKGSDTRDNPHHTPRSGSNRRTIDEDNLLQTALIQDATKTSVQDHQTWRELPASKFINTSRPTCQNIEENIINNRNTTDNVSIVQDENSVKVDDNGNDTVYQNEHNDVNADDGHHRGDAVDDDGGSRGGFVKSL